MKSKPDGYLPKPLIPTEKPSFVGVFLSVSKPPFFVLRDVPSAQTQTLKTYVL